MEKRLGIIHFLYQQDVVDVSIQDLRLELKTPKRILLPRQHFTSTIITMVSKSPIERTEWF